MNMAKYFQTDVCLKEVAMLYYKNVSLLGISNLQPKHIVCVDCKETQLASLACTSVWSSTFTFSFPRGVSDPLAVQLSSCLQQQRSNTFTASAGGRPRLPRCEALWADLWPSRHLWDNGSMFALQTATQRRRGPNNIWQQSRKTSTESVKLSPFMIKYLQQ